MDVRSLQYFVRIATLGNITRAAADLRIAQPALTRHVHRLEDELGVKLFTRVQRGVEPTAAGRKLLQSASKILRDIDRLPADVRADETRPAGKVTLGFNQPLCPAVVPEIMTRARKEFPQLRIKVVHGSNSTLMPWLLDGVIDVAVMPEMTARRALSPVELVREELVLLTAPKAGPRGRAVSLRELSGIPLMMGDANRSIVELILERQKVEIDVETEVNDHETIRLMVQAGVGATILPYSLVRRECQAKALRAYRIGEGVYRQLSLAVAPARDNGPARTAVTGLLRRVFADMDQANMFALK